jgi:hypothetical protein
VRRAFASTEGRESREEAGRLQYFFAVLEEEERSLKWRTEGARRCRWTTACATTSAYTPYPPAPTPIPAEPRQRGFNPRHRHPHHPGPPQPNPRRNGDTDVVASQTRKRHTFDAKWGHRRLFFSPSSLSPLPSRTTHPEMKLRTQLTPTSSRCHTQQVGRKMPAHPPREAGDDGGAGATCGFLQILQAKQHS